MTNGSKAWLRRGVLTLVVLALLAVGALFTGDWLAGRKMARHVEVKVQPVAYRDDAASLARGQYLFASRGCVDCHGAQGNGRTFADDGKGLRIKGPNISPGAGSVVAAYTPVDWVRSIRHGVDPTGRALRVMPSEDYNRFTDDDLAALVAYVRHLPPAEGSGAIVELPLPVRAMYGFGAFRDAAGKIDHSLAPAQPVPDAVSLAHGAYVANMCLGCHGTQLTGGKVPGGPPDWPPAANLTPGEGSAMTRYPDAASFASMFKSGKRPDGSEIKVMPFGSLGQLNDTDTQALYLYLRSLPARKPG